MSSNSLRKLLSQNFLIVNKNLLSVLGPCPTLLLSLLIDKESYWVDKGEARDGWFFKLAEEIEEELSLSDHDRRNCIKKLEFCGLIHTKRVGVPCKLYYKINWGAIEKLLDGNGVKNRVSDDDKKANDIDRDLNLRPLDLESLDLKRSKISTSITKNSDTKNSVLTTQGEGLGGDFKDNYSKPEKKDVKSSTPTVDQIRRSWERSFLVEGQLPQQSTRLPLLRDLMATLKSYGYQESDLPRSFPEVTTSHWWSKAKDKKVREAMRDNSLKEYDLALADLHDQIQITIAPKIKNNVQKRHKASHEAGSMSLDTFFDLVDQGAIDDTDEFFKYMDNLANREDL